MPQFFFTVSDDGVVFRDDKGQPFESAEAAIAHANTIAQELAGDGKNYSGYVVVVMDEHGREFARIPVPAK